MASSEQLVHAACKGVFPCTPSRAVTSAPAWRRGAMAEGLRVAATCRGLFFVAEDISSALYPSARTIFRALTCGQSELYHHHHHHHHHHYFYYYYHYYNYHPLLLITIIIIIIIIIIILESPDLCYPSLPPSSLNLHFRLFLFISETDLLRQLFVLHNEREITDQNLLSHPESFS